MAVGRTQPPAAVRTRGVVHAEKTAARASAAALALGQRVATVSDALGSKAKLAAFLEISASQPTRWITGAENPNPENARTIVDLDHVIARAGLLWTPEVIRSWLVGANAFLGGARPIDVVKTRGSAPVIEALDQELAGAFA